MGLEISHRQVGDTTVIDLAGDLVLPGCGDLHVQVKKLLQAGTGRISLNLKKVGNIDQHGLGTLSACYVSVLREFSTLSLLSPSQEVLDAIKRIRLEKVVQVYETEADLLASAAQESGPEESKSLIQQLRQGVCALLWGFLALVLIVLWMQISHPAVLDRLPWLVELEKLVLRPLGGISNQPAPVFFYLFLLIFGCSVALIWLDERLHWLHRMFKGKSQ